MLDIFYAILFMWLWIAILKFRKNIKNIIWPIASIEHYLWRWSTYFVIILFAFAMMYIWTQFLFWNFEHTTIK
mgnify:CR=1 FL=1